MPAQFVGVVIAIGTAHLVAYYGGMQVVAGVLKPLPVLLLAWAVWSLGDVTPSYRALLAAGLIFSAVGDVSLVFQRGFLAGLASFFVAHLCYITAFAAGARSGPSAMLVAVGLAVLGVAMLSYLWPHVARRRGPIVAYVAVLTTMAWCAMARALTPGALAGAGAAAAGSLSFLVSDGALAVNRFARPFAGAHGVVMVTYYAAQLLIAASALI